MNSKLITPAITVATLLLATVLMFARLGHYAVWDDEAMIALAAKGVLQTGDTSVQPDDHNLLAYRDGMLSLNLRDRSTPPLSAYLAAGSFALFGQNAFAARLPFALFGLATVALLLYWAGKDSTIRREAPVSGKKPSKSSARQTASALLPPPWLVPALVSLGTLGNVSLFLYSRQCRYYAPAVFLSLAVAYLYLHWRGGKRTLGVMALLSVLLFASNYLNYLALYLCIAFDYLLWRRKEHPLKFADWSILLGPQIVLCGALSLVWNPLKTQFGSYVEHNSVWEKLTLFLWQWRDLDRCEFISGALLLAAAGMVLMRRDKWLARGLVALALYVAVVTAISPQTVKLTSVADIRYLVPLIPLCIAVSVRTLLLITGNKAWLAVGFALVAFGTNLPNGGPLLWCGMRSTVADYAGELMNPPSEPYSPAAEWINENVREGESIWVLPDYMTYPLMFHAPKVTYAWQLAPNNHSPQFAGLPPIHFQGRTPPDTIIAFGPVAQQVRQAIAGWQGVRYEQTTTIDCFWKDMFRPELFWRTFKPTTGYNKETDAIYVFKRQRS